MSKKHVETNDWQFNSGFTSIFFGFIGVLVVITIKHTGIELNKYPLSDFVIGYYRFIRGYTWFVRVCYSLFKRDNHVQTTTMQ